jgi:hypothetical protein
LSCFPDKYSFPSAIFNSSGAQSVTSIDGLYKLVVLLLSYTNTFLICLAELPYPLTLSYFTKCQGWLFVMTFCLKFHKPLDDDSTLYELPRSCTASKQTVTLVP